MKVKDQKATICRAETTYQSHDDAREHRLEGRECEGLELVGRVLLQDRAEVADGQRGIVLIAHLVVRSRRGFFAAKTIGIASEGQREPLEELRRNRATRGSLGSRACVGYVGSRTTGGGGHGGR